MPLNAQISLSILAHETSNGDLSRTLRATPANYAIALTDGTGANQAQVVWSASMTTTTTPASGDLPMSALPDTRDGASVTVAFSAVKAVYVRNKSNSQSLVIGFAGVANFSGFPTAGGLVRPGGCYVALAPNQDGFPVLAGHMARIQASSGSADFDVVFIGEGSIS